MGNALGFNTVKGSCLMMLLPMTEKQQKKIDRALADQARRYYTTLEKPGYPVPPLIYLWFFRMGRTKIRLELDEGSPDFTYYQDKGWLESDFYYPTDLGVLKKGAGKIFDSVSASMARHR